jgi:cytochrome c peroxidase
VTVSRSSAAILVVTAAIAACGDTPESEPAGVGGGGAYAGPPIPWAYEPFPRPIEAADNPSTPEKNELGNLLFYDPVLSRDDATACATCHSEIWGMSDGLPVSVGVDGEGPTGPGRDGPNKTTRNAQTLWNAAFRSELFLDGRSPSLEHQALEPLRAERELALDPEAAAAKLRAIPAYVVLFQQAFPAEAEPVTPENLARALASFQRTLVSDQAPYDQYVAGDEAALRPEWVEGMFLFAEGGCAGCHVPPLFESNRYVSRLGGADPGRAVVTNDPADAGAIRVPTLRNARDSEPYFHDGSVLLLEDAVRVEAEISASRGEGRALSAEEIALVTKFINKALTDRTRDPRRPKEVPSGLEVPEDGFRIPR